MQSKSEKFLRSRELPPMITNSMAKSVSEYRRATLQEEVEKGLFRDGSTKVSEGRLAVVGTPPSQMALTKQANSDFNTGSSAFRGAMGDTLRQISGIYSPLWLNSNLNLPRDRATINAWLRSFYALHPWVHNAINLHSTYPISKLSIKCANKKVEQFFNTMIEDIDLMNVCTQVAQEFWLLGEAFIYAELDERRAVWSRLMIQNPDYVVVKRSVIASEPLVMLRPDENLRRIVFSNRPADIEQRKQLNPTIIDHIKRGENIPLDPFYVSHLARRISPYEVRGTGLPVCCFRQMMILDLLRESKFVQAQSMINPLTVVSLGAQQDYRTNSGDLEAWREILAQAEFDPNYKIITHDGVKIERIGWNQGIYDISGDITQLLKEIYMGLMVPQVIIEGGGDITYANGGVSLDVLKQRYMQFRNMLAQWLTKKIFAPISKLNEFYEYKDGEKVLIIPEVEWSHMAAFDTNDYIQVLVQLSTGEQKKVSQQTLYRSLGLDYDDEQVKMKKEMIQDAIRKKEMMSLDRIALNELRAIAESDDIPEISEPATVDSPYADQMGGMPGGPGGDMGMGGGLGGGMGGGLGGSLPPLPGVPAGPPAGGGGGPSAPGGGPPPVPPPA